MTEERLWPLYHVSELAGLPEPEWLVSEVLTDGLTVMYGPPGAGKTFAALSMALCLGSGTAWHQRAVKRTPVVYVSGEGVGGLSRRVEGWQVAEGASMSQVYVVPFGVRFGGDQAHAVALRADIHAVGAGLLVVDTLARSMAGSDENSAQDMGQHIQALDWLMERTGCAVLVVHHSGVDGSRPRGSTALFGAADTLIRVDGDGRMVDVSCEKQKDAAPFRRMHFELASAGRSVSMAERNAPASSSMPTPF